MSLNTYVFDIKKDSILYFKRVTCLMGIILPPRDFIPQNQSINRLIRFKESLKKLPSNFPLYPGQKIRLNTYVFHKKSIFLYILSKMKALRGIILPKTYNMSLNDSIGSAFPFHVPFHPGEGPEIDYPNEPEYPEEDPGDDPDD
jgi:hypothetical protein